MAEVARGGTFNIVRQVTVDEETLVRIAELLGIPDDERRQLISGTIYIGAARGRVRPPAPSSGAPPSATRRPRRRQK
jgi:hypothetical protein